MLEESQKVDAQHALDELAFLTGKPADILLLRKSLGFFYNNPKEDADRNNHSGNVVVGTEPLMRWAMCQGGANPEWIATVIQTEVDAPLTGSVDGIRQADVAVRLKAGPQTAVPERQGAMHKH